MKHYVKDNENKEAAKILLKANIGRDIYARKCKILRTSGDKCYVYKHIGGKRFEKMEKFIYL